MSKIFLAWSISGSSRRTFEKWEWKEHPINLLVSFYYLKQYRSTSQRHHYKPAATILDSGAFSAWKSGKAIDMNALIEESLNPYWHEVVALDDIENVQRSVSNTFAMAKRGSPCFPVFHYGEPWETLYLYQQHFSRIGLSCRFGEKKAESLRWLDQCFARVYPHRFHSFGWVDRDALFNLPFDTADTATWNVRPAAFGGWTSFNGAKLSARGPTVDTRSEVFYYLDYQKELEHRWKKELQKLRSLASKSTVLPKPSISSSGAAAT